MIRLVFLLIFLLILGPLSWVTNDILLSAVVMGIGFPHIILGVKYSRRGLENAWNVKQRKGFLMLLIPLSILLGLKFGGLGLVIYFGLHHAISETYAHKSLFENKTRFTGAYFMLILSSYFIACRDDFTQNKFLIIFCVIALFMASIAMLFLFKSYKLKTQNLKHLVINYPWLVAAPLLVLFSLIKPISWNVLILYHFIFWGILPFFRKDMFINNKKGLKSFWKDAIVWNGTWLLAIGLLALWSSIYVDFRVFQVALLLLYIATYWHISLSFIISGANPSWLKKLI